MNENLRKKIVYSVLPIAIIWAGFNLKSKEDKKSELVKIATIQKISGTTAIEVSIREKLSIEYDNKNWGSDPFHSPVKQKVVSKQKTYNKPDWNLTGIMYNKSNPLAVINKKYVSEGDKIGNGKVLTIDREKVIIEHKGRKYTLRVSKG